MSKMKAVALSVLGILLLLAIGGYFYLKSMGIIPTIAYETDPPELPQFTRPAVLVLNKVNGFIHKDALPAADMALTSIAQQNGWDIYITDNAASHNAADLQRFALVVWNNVSGDVLTESQRQDLREWIEAGGGWLGIHGSGGDPAYDWRWYVETLVGAQFIGHTMSPQFQDAQLHSTNEATHYLPAPWSVAHEEWYAFDQSPENNSSEILVAIDEASYITKGQTFWGGDSMEGEHPMVWRHGVGRGRAFYSAIGHQAATYQLPEYRQLLSDAMRWAMQPEN
jgi:type 1 glutamine amidotransferase